MLGDGVNVASRLEPLAGSNEIFVSDPVYRNVKNKPGINSYFVKETELKNVDDVVRIYNLSVAISGRNARK